MSKRNQSHVADGEVVLVDKAKVPQAKPIIEISHRQAEALRPKRELSEKQKENLAKLIQRNKDKASEWKNQKVPERLEEIPEDKVAIQVKPKRAYVRKAPHHLSNGMPLPEKLEEVKEAKPLPEKLEEVKEAKPKRVYKRAVKTPPPSESDESEVEVRPRRRRIVSDTSDFSDDDDYRTTKYVAKANARLQTVQQIERQIQAKVNPYSSRGLSVF